MSAHPENPQTFDANAVEQKIKDHLDQAKEVLVEATKETTKALEEAKVARDEHVLAAARLLYEVQQNQPDKELKAMCNRLHIRKTRRDELLAIGGGRKTLEEVRAETKARTERTRAAKKEEKAKAAGDLAKAQAALKAQADDPLQPVVAGDADNENDPDANPVDHAKSAEALDAFKTGSLKCLSMMSPIDQQLAFQFVEDTIKQNRRAAA